MANEEKDLVSNDVPKKEKPKGLSKEEKAKAKFAKLEEKRLKKEKQREVYEDLKEGYKEFESAEGRKKKAKEAKVKKIKEKVDYKLAIREFPVKVVKEIQKVRWPSQSVLGSRLIWVLGFIILLAVVFYFVDWGIQSLFGVAKII
jgi:preprotein translocase subunit SecE